MAIIEKSNMFGKFDSNPLHIMDAVEANSSSRKAIIIQGLFSDEHDTMSHSVKLELSHTILKLLKDNYVLIFINPVSNNYYSVIKGEGIYVGSFDKNPEVSVDGKPYTEFILDILKKKNAKIKTVLTFYSYMNSYILPREMTYNLLPSIDREWFSDGAVQVVAKLVSSATEVSAGDFAIYTELKDNTSFTTNSLHYVRYSLLSHLISSAYTISSKFESKILCSEFILDNGTIYTLSATGEVVKLCSSLSPKKVASSGYAYQTKLENIEECLKGLSGKYMLVTGKLNEEELEILKKMHDAGVKFVFVDRSEDKVKREQLNYAIGVDQYIYLTNGLFGKGYKSAINEIGEGKINSILNFYDVASDDGKDVSRMVTKVVETSKSMLTANPVLLNVISLGKEDKEFRGFYKETLSQDYMNSIKMYLNKKAPNVSAKYIELAYSQTSIDCAVMAIGHKLSSENKHDCSVLNANVLTGAVYQIVPRMYSKI